MLFSPLEDRSHAVLFLSDNLPDFARLHRLNHTGPSLLNRYILFTLSGKCLEAGLRNTSNPGCLRPFISFQRASSDGETDSRVPY
jgi:hypothetical protein